MPIERSAPGENAMKIPRFVLVSFLVAFAATVGSAAVRCRAQTTEGHSAASQPSAAADVLKAAPADWSDAQLAATPAAERIPARPKLASDTRWPIIRLDDRIDSARIKCDWRVHRGGDSTLAAIGPFRTDQPTDMFAVDTDSDSGAMK